MSASNLGNRVDRFFAPHNFSKKVTLHVLRRSAPMNWIGNGMNIFHVPRLLRHEHITTTQLYICSNLADREAELKKIGMDDGNINRLNQVRTWTNFLSLFEKGYEKSRLPILTSEALLSHLNGPTFTPVLYKLYLS